MSASKEKDQIIKKLKEGDVFSFDEIYREYNKKIYSFSLNYLKNKEDAEGVVQHVFLTLWRKRADIRTEHDIGSYLFTITYNTIRNHFRKLADERRKFEEFSRTILTEDDSTITRIEYDNMVELADKMIVKLPPRQRIVYQLSIRDGLTNYEVAEKLKISVRTVENHLYRAKSFLKEALSDNRLKTLLFIWLFIR